MALRAHFRSIAVYNWRTLHDSPLAELSGSLGDLGTLLPLMIAMALKGSIDLPATLVFSGLTNIVTGAIYGIPLPVQPMKAIASVAISRGFNKEETAAAGLTMGVAVFLLSATGLLRWLNRVVPVPVVKGIQVGAGLALVINAGTGMLKPLEWTSPGYDNKIWAIVAFLLLIAASLVRRLPYALIVFIFGIVIAGAVQGQEGGGKYAGIWHPVTVVPSGSAWKVGAIDAAIPQLPLTTLNSILAVCSLSAFLFPSYPPTPSTTSIGLSVAVSNLIGCWFGAMPICHGSGGLAGQYRFGGRSGSSIIILGLIKLILGLFVGEAIVPLLQKFPKSLLGIMVLAAGVELAKVGQSVSESRDLWEQAEQDNENGQPLHDGKSKDDLEQERRDRWMIMLITVAGCLAFKNDAVGFFAGWLWHYALKIPDWIEKLRDGDGRIRLRHERDEEEGSGLLDVNHNDPERD